MPSLRGLSDKELSALLSRADEQMVDAVLKSQKDVDAGRITPEQNDYVVQDLLDARIATKHEIESEQRRRAKNAQIRNRIISAVAALFMAGMFYLLFLK